MGLDAKRFNAAVFENTAKTWRTLLASNLTEEEFSKVRVEAGKDGVTLWAPPELNEQARKIVGLPEME